MLPAYCVRCVKGAIEMPRVTVSYRTWPLQYRTVLLYLYHRTVLYEMPARGGSLPKMLKISNGICELTVNPTGL